MAINGWVNLVSQGADPQEIAERIRTIAENMETLRNTVIDYLQAHGADEDGKKR